MRALGWHVILSGGVVRWRWPLSRDVYVPLHSPFKMMSSRKKECSRKLQNEIAQVPRHRSLFGWCDEYDTILRCILLLPCSVTRYIAGQGSDKHITDLWVSANFNIYGTSETSTFHRRTLVKIGE